MSDVARLVRIVGALAEAEPLAEGASLYELVRVGSRGLLGEVVRIAGRRGTIQVYEETSGLSLGEPVTLTHEALTIELGPGLLGGVLDGVGRPLVDVALHHGDFVTPGTTSPTLDASRRWAFTPTVQPGSVVHGGDQLGTVEERPGFVHRVLVPPDISGTVASIDGGHYTVHEPFGRLTDDTPLSLAHRWPVRRPRPVSRRLASHVPFITGQRVFDLLFPVAEGGSVALPGGFGTGKTVIEQSLAKYAKADVVIYVGCGERGNEMAEVLEEFPRLTDLRTGQSVMDRTVLLVNTSNMPVAAREASVYVGITIAEFYRDMGYRVALMADSLSRWAEALREISARLQEMPGEEGYPTYLGNRLGQFYERAGLVATLGQPPREGSLTVIGAISPPGGDFSEPVTQASLRVTGALWALDPELAHQRQFPAVDWETSYSLHAESTTAWFVEHVDADWPAVRRETLALLQRDRDLREIAALVGPEALQDEDRLLLEAARLVRDNVLGQSAYDPNDALSTLTKTFLLASLAREVLITGTRALASGRSFEQLELTGISRLMAELRSAPLGELDARAAALRQALEGVAG
jgi:V/A-type H+-transporting ATPase subunit A